MTVLVDEVKGHDGGQVFGEGGGEMFEGIKLLENLELSINKKTWNFPSIKASDGKILIIVIEITK